MSETRRNRRRNKKLTKSDISNKDKIYGIFAIVVLFLFAIVAVVYFAFVKAR